MIEMTVALLTEKDVRFKNLFGNISIFILLGLVGIGLSFVWTGIKKGEFTAKSKIYFVADSGQDLSEGMPVKLSGFKIGKLNSLALDEHGFVQVEISIEKKYIKLIRQDAVVRLKKEGVIGDGVLEIIQGTKESPSIVAGAKVRFARAVGLEQAVIDMKDRIMPILDDLHQTLSNPDGDVRQTLKNLHEFTVEIRSTREHLDHVLGSADGSINNQLEPLLISLRQTAVHAEKMSAILDHDLPGILKNASAGVDNLYKTSDILKESVQLSAPQLPKMLGDTSEVLNKTRKLIDSTQDDVDLLNASWPLSIIVPAPQNGPVNMDSHD